MHHLGFCTLPLHPPEKEWRRSLAEDREAFLLADRLGYSEAFVGDHCTDRAENITSCTMFLASLASEVRSMRLGTGTVNLALAHPVRVAAEVAMLDHMLNGRLEFGISPGGLASDAEAFGVLGADRAGMFRESLEAILALWAGDAPYSVAGERWTISTRSTLFPEIGQGFVPRPLQRPHPPISVAAVAPSSNGVREAAARGFGVLTPAFMAPEAVATHGVKVDEGAARGGFADGRSRWRVARLVFVADDERVARAYARGTDGPYHGFVESLVRKFVRGGRADVFKRDPSESDASVTPEAVLARTVICGTPRQVARELRELGDRVGGFGTLLYTGVDWQDPALARRSMELMVREVMPEIAAAR